jgi:dTDP-4-amino-4,6-dideoxygalactose transaminase
LPELTAQRSRIAATYDEQLELLVPLLQADERPAWHIYSRVMPYGVSRDAVRVGIHARGVQTSVHYPPVHRSPAFRQFARAELPTTDEYTTRTLTLPLFAHMSGEQVLTVIDSVKTALAATRSSRGRNAAAIPVNPPGPAA